MKLPVFRAIGATFAFLASHIVDVLIIAWLPLALNFVAFVLIMPGYITAASKMQEFGPGSDPAEIAPAVMGMLPHAALLIVAAVLFNLVLICGLQRLVIRGEKPSLPFYLAFGADEVRLLVATLAGLAIDVAIGVAFAVLIFFGDLLAGLGPGPGGIVRFIAIIGLAISTIYVSLRLSLIAPATVDQRKIGLLPSWRTSEENVGNLLGYWLIFGVMIFAVQVVVGVTGLATPPGYTDAMAQVFTSGSPADARAAVKHANEIMLGMYAFNDVGNTIRLVISYLCTSTIYILLAIAGGVAWRYLTGEAGAGEGDA